jgi:glycosyltransferase involved in cell wall biosynthesis
MAVSLNLAEQIYFTGRLSFEELNWYTHQADIGVSLEQDIGLNYRLSLPNKLYDYMNAGLPVVASDLPEIGRLVREADFGILVAEYSPKFLAEAIRNIWEDRSLYKQYSENALMNSSLYTWETQEKDLYDLYQRAIKSAR